MRSILSAFGASPFWIAALVGAFPASAQIAWLDPVSGNWSDAARWESGNIPDSAAETAQIAVPGSYAVELDQDIELGGLLLTNPLAQLNIQLNRSLFANGPSWTNNGLIVVNSAASNIAYFRVRAPILSLGGAGVLQLNADSSDTLFRAQIATSHDQNRLVNDVGHSIRGRGIIAVNVVNHGHIRAEGVTEHIKFEGAAIQGLSVSNNGTIEAADGGIVEISSCDVTNYAGNSSFIAGGGGKLRFLWSEATFDSDNLVSAEGAASEVSFVGGTIRGGTYSGVNGGRIIFGAQIGNCTLVGDSALGRAELVGDITNNGTISITGNESGFASLTTNIGLQAATVNGNGIIVLNAAQTDLTTAGINNPAASGGLTLGSGQRIRGRGVLQGILINEGIVEADDPASMMSIRAHQFTNNSIVRSRNGGNLVFESATVINNGEIRLDDVQASLALVGSSFVGGEITVVAGAMGSIRNAVFDGNVLSGAFQVISNTALGVAGSGITNNGMITINHNHSSLGASLRAENSTGVFGTGTLLLNANATNLDTARLGTANGADSLTLGPGQTLAGSGTIRVQTVIEGTLAPGLSSGDIGRIEQRQYSMTLGSSAEFAIDADGAAAGQYDTFGASGRVNLDGTLRLNIASGYSPAPGDELVVLNANPAVGEFDELIAPPAPPDTNWRIRYETNRVIVTLTCPRDLDGDHAITLQDLSILLASFGTFEGATGAQGDFDSDGDVDIQDLALLLAAFGNTCF